MTTFGAMSFEELHSQSITILKLQKVGGFHKVLWFPPPIKLTATI